MWQPISKILCLSTSKLFPTSIPNNFSHPKKILITCKQQERYQPSSLFPKNSRITKTSNRVINHRSKRSKKENLHKKRNTMKAQLKWRRVIRHPSRVLPLTKLLVKDLIWINSGKSIHHWWQVTISKWSKKIKKKVRRTSQVFWKSKPNRQNKWNRQTILTKIPLELRRYSLPAFLMAVQWPFSSTCRLKQSKQFTSRP